MKVLIAHPGTQYSHQLARQLFLCGILYEFHTGFAFGKDSWFYKICSRFPARIFNSISNRFIDEVPDRYIKRQAFNELKALLNVKAGKHSETVIFNRNKNFQNGIKENSIAEADVIIGFDTSSYILAEKCRKLRKPFVLDVSIGHPVAKEKVYSGIVKQFPDWKFTLHKKDHAQIMLEEQEMQRSDHVVVASHFSLSTYEEQGIPKRKISVNSYGVDSDKFSPSLKKKNPESVAFVFVGLADARKGIPLLLQAWKHVRSGKHSLTLIGPVSPEIKRIIAEQYPDVIIMGKISLEQLQLTLPEYDVLIFPSYFEGFGLVIPEAMACGLPVITTSATCGPDIIVNGKEGFIIEPGNEEMLQKSIQYFINVPEKIAEMGSLAHSRSKQLTWQAYGERWKSILSSVK